MGIIYSLLNNQENYENNNDDYIIDIKEVLHNTTDYRDYYHICYQKTLLHDYGVDILNIV